MGALASQVQCTIRHCPTECEHTKERWIASQSAFLMFTLSEWMDEWKDSSLFLNRCFPRKAFQMVCLDVCQVNKPE